MEKPLLFRDGEYYMFSNFSSFAVAWRGVVWMTSEHAYQAAKFTDESVILKIKNALSAHEAKTIAHEHEELMDSDFKDKKISLMKEIVLAKVSQHEYIRNKLLVTQSRAIIEDSPWDAFWGSGVDGLGENHLGKIWMEVREEIRKNETV